MTAFTVGVVIGPESERSRLPLSGAGARCSEASDQDQARVGVVPERRLTTRMTAEIANARLP